MSRSVILAAVAVIVAVTAIAIPTAEKSIDSLTQAYILDLASSKGETVERAIAKAGNAEDVFKGEAGEILKGCNVKDMPSSYAYLVSPDGTMVFHPTADKIGQPVENSVIKGVVADLKAGKTVKNKTVLYNFNGTKKYAGYYVPADRDFILVVSCDYSDVVKPVRSMASSMILVGIIIAVIAGAGALLIITKQLSPVDTLNDVMDRVGSLDLTDDTDAETLLSRHDEFGLMGQSIHTMKSSLKSTVSVIQQQAKDLKASSDALLSNTANLTETADQVDTAVNDIAQGATSQAQQTQDAQNDAEGIGNQISGIAGSVTDLNAVSEKMDAADRAAGDTIEALNRINGRTQQAIADISESTKKTNASASEIREAASLISDIASQTNLLSLNASIEAARAGEHGKGFAVVAGSIGDLANQSKDAADKINEIIERLVSVADESVKTMDEVMDIVKQQSDEIVKTSDAFKRINDGISASTAAVKTISSQASDMNTSKDSIISVLKDLSSIAEENAAATEQSSASVTQMTENMDDIKRQSDGVRKAADSLSAEIGKFKL